MTHEALLIPRYKCIADYPQWPFETNGIRSDSYDHKFIKGDLLIQCNVNGAITFKRHGRLGHMSVGVPCISNPEKYPNIFQPLPWWCDRKIEDLPEYVKCINTPDQVIQPGQIFKARWLSPSAGRAATGQYIVVSTNCYQPATREEYELFKEQK